MIKKPLKVCVDLPGLINHGVLSPERGESRWAQNLAWGLAERGHQVTAYSYMYGGPQWGVCPPITNLKLMPYRQARAEGPYDVFVDNCYWEGKPLVVQATLNLVGKYGSEEWTKSLPDNFLVVSPYNSSWLQKHEKAVWLPAPYFKKLGESRFNNAGILLPSRGVCGKESVAANAANVLRCLSTLVHPYRLSGFHFLVAGLRQRAFITEEGEKGRAELELRDKYDLVALARKLPGWILYDLRPWNEVLSLLGKYCKLNIPLYNPSNVIDAAMKGVPSLLWDGGGFEWLQEIASQDEWKLSYESPPERIREVIELLCHNKDSYARLLKLQQEAISSLEWGPALDKWEHTIYERL